jgi:hypothetical protein
MGILDLIRPKGSITAEVTIDGLPPHWALVVSALSLRVSSAAIPPITDVHKFKSDCVKEREAQGVWPLRFVLCRRAGFYYVGLSVIAFRTDGGKSYAQVERFFPMSSPCRLESRSDQRVVLNVRWPDIPLSELGSYGTVYPSGRSGSDA